jgi:hypothetical protein
MIKDNTIKTSIVKILIIQFNTFLITLTNPFIDMVLFLHLNIVLYRHLLGQLIYY